MLCALVLSGVTFGDDEAGPQATGGQESAAQKAEFDRTIAGSVNTIPHDDTVRPGPRSQRELADGPGRMPAPTFQVLSSASKGRAVRNHDLEPFEAQTMSDLALAIRNAKSLEEAQTIANELVRKLKKGGVLEDALHSGQGQTGWSPAEHLAFAVCLTVPGKPLHPDLARILTQAIAASGGRTGLARASELPKDAPTTNAAKDSALAASVASTPGKSDPTIPAPALAPPAGDFDSAKKEGQDNDTSPVTAFSLFGENSSRTSPVITPTPNGTSPVTNPLAEDGLTLGRCEGFGQQPSQVPSRTNPNLAQGDGGPRGGPQGGGGPGDGNGGQGMPGIPSSPPASPQNKGAKMPNMAQPSPFGNFFAPTPGQETPMKYEPTPYGDLNPVGDIPMSQFPMAGFPAFNRQARTPWSMVNRLRNNRMRARANRQSASTKKQKRTPGNVRP